jgi:hypothetical protein
MDAPDMFPQGFHPVEDVLLPDLSDAAPILPRLDVGVRYYFVDYGISSYFPAGSQRELVVARAGRDQDVPELSDTVPYDPFKVDIFTIGNVLRCELQDVCFHSPAAHIIVSPLTTSQNYSNLGFFTPLIEHMTQQDPSGRPTAEQALQQWRTLRSRINPLRRYWRLRERREPALIVPILDVYYTLGFIPRIFRFLGRMFQRNPA